MDKPNYYNNYSFFPNNVSNDTIFVPSNYYFKFGNTIRSMYWGIRMDIKWGKYHQIKYENKWFNRWISWPNNFSTLLYCLIRPKSIFDGI